MVADRRYRFLLNIVNHLPRNSHYVTAVADDDELAAAEEARREAERQEAYARGEDPPEPSGARQRSLRDFSPEVELLTEAVDRLGSLIQGVSKQINPKKKAPKVRPQPRPRTAADRVKSRRDREDLAYLNSRLRPKNKRPPPDDGGGDI